MVATVAMRASCTPAMLRSTVAAPAACRGPHRCEAGLAQSVLRLRQRHRPRWRCRWKSRPQMLKELGYAGIGFTGAQRIPEMLGPSMPAG